MLGGFAQRTRHFAPVGLLPVLRRDESLQPCQQRRAAFEVGGALRRLGGKIDAARLIGLLRGVVKALPLGLGVFGAALADELPLILQLLDARGQRRRRFVSLDQRFHLFDELGALGRDHEAAPVLQRAQLRIEGLQLARELRRHAGQRLQLVLDGAAQPCGLPRIAGRQRALRLAHQSGHLAQGGGRGGLFIGARLLPGAQRSACFLRLGRGIFAEQLRNLERIAQCAHLLRTERRGQLRNRAVLGIERGERFDRRGELPETSAGRGIRRLERSERGPLRLERGQRAGGILRLAGQETTQLGTLRIDELLALRVHAIEGRDARRLMGHLLLMLFDDLPAAREGCFETRGQLHRRPLGMRRPLCREMIDGRDIGAVEGLRNMALERSAQRAHQLEFFLHRAPLRMDRIALVLEYAIDILVLAARVLEQAQERGQFLYALGGELANDGRGALDGEAGVDILIADRGHRAGQQ